MRRFRNPRYAPEGLERKLSPSGFSIPVTAEIAPATPTATPAKPELAATPALVGLSLTVAQLAHRAASASAFDPPPSNPSPTPPPAPMPLDPWSEPQPPSCPDAPN